jgi:hypothetical protein
MNPTPESFDDLDDTDAGFTDWLRKQAERDDATGDLARDYTLQCRVHRDDLHADCPACRQTMATRTVDDMRRKLHGAAYEAFERALDEFRTYELFA